jgi:hypothetical protein
MARVVVLGGGIAGHTAALHLTRMLKRSDEVVVVTPNSNWNWIPSNIWVGVGKMKADQVTFKLGPVYKRKGIAYEQALATAIHPEGGRGRPPRRAAAPAQGRTSRSPIPIRPVPASMASSSTTTWSTPLARNSISVPPRGSGRTATPTRSAPQAMPSTRRRPLTGRSPG